jgi:hypothetical protein
MEVEVVASDKGFSKHECFVFYDILAPTPNIFKQPVLTFYLSKRNDCQRDKIYDNLGEFLTGHKNDKKNIPLDIWGLFILLAHYFRKLVYFGWLRKLFGILFRVIDFG